MQNQKNFTTFLWGAPFIGSIGRSMYDIAIIWLILDITNSEKTSSADVNASAIVWIIIVTPKNVNNIITGINI